MKYVNFEFQCSLKASLGTVIEITKPPPAEGAWSALLRNCLDGLLNKALQANYLQIFNQVKKYLTTTQTC